ncbi:MAG TPA: alpha-amylase family glycosyl hydrolase [Bacteroidales bacterium]|nr:alpha-amylase family glycosyl hydrolase [Bacteroidales bacterium]
MRRISTFTGTLMLGLLLIGLDACQPSRPAGEEPILGLAGPLRLVHGNNLIVLGDFFQDPLLIDSIQAPEGSWAGLEDSGRVLRLIPPEKMHGVDALRFRLKGEWYDIPVYAPSALWVGLRFDPQGKQYSEVTVVGEMNAWDPRATPMEWSGRAWEVMLMLEPGQYQYQFVADGQWVLDPAAVKQVPNGIGGTNSQMEVGDVCGQLTPHLKTQELQGRKVVLSANNGPVGAVAFWQNHQIRGTELRQGQVVLNIPKEAARMKRSWIRVYAWNAYGRSNDVLIPLEKGVPVLDPSQLTEDDPQRKIIYNVFIDRFFNGDSTNDRPLRTPEVHPRADYHGGDLAGVRKKVQDGYFKSLGINTLWISPVVRNPEGPYGQWPDPQTRFSGYHGYWPVSFTQVDPRFGKADELRGLVDEAHGQGLGVLLDFVANHVHEEHPFYRAHPEVATSLYLPDGSLNTERWDEYRLTTWFDVFLPTLDLEREPVREMLSDSALFWLKEFNLDGFRHDATKHIPESFWRLLTRKIKDSILVKDHERSIYQIGETYGSPQLISSYVGPGMLDAQFDFNLYDALANAAGQKEGSFEKVRSVQCQSLRWYGHHHLMGNISGNQDRGRFISYAGGALAFGEDAKKAGWTREIGVGDPRAYDRLMLVHAFNFTVPGLPVIFYGDEIGMPGGNDPDNRRMMRFEGLSPQELEVKQCVSDLAGLRSHSLALLYGDMELVYLDQDLYVYRRTYFNESMIILLNRSESPRELNIPAGTVGPYQLLGTMNGHPATLGGAGLEVRLRPLSFEIITLKKSL